MHVTLKTLESQLTWHENFIDSMTTEIYYLQVAVTVHEYDFSSMIAVFVF